MSALPWLLALPLAAAGITAALVRRRRDRSAAALGVVTSLVLLGLALVLVAEVAPGPAARHRLLDAGGLALDLRADGLAALLVVVAAVVGVVGAVYAAGYRRTAPLPGAFWPWWLLLTTAMNGVFLLGHLFALYVAFELVGVAAAALVALSGGRAIRSARRYLVVAVAGSLVFLVGAALLYAATGTLALAELPGQAEPSLAAGVALALMTLGLLATAALFPLHFWLPDAHAQAPAPASPLLSALVLKVYFYVVIVLWFQALPQLVTPAAGVVLGVAGAAAILWGGVAALTQRSVKRLVVYSTLSQMGYLWLIPAILAGQSEPDAAGWFGWHGGIYYAVTHSSAKAAMLMAAGALVHAAGADRLVRLRGAAARAPAAVFAFALAGVNLVGLPPTGGFVGKWYLLSAAVAGGQWWIAAVVLAGGGLTAAYLIRVLRLAFMRSEPAPDPAAPALALPALGLALVTVLLGFRAVEVLALLEVGAPAVAGGAT